jgi:hypothetical protein
LIKLRTKIIRRINVSENKICKKLEIELRRDNDKVFTPWQIQDFISKLASNYYKLDLLNCLAEKIKEGIKQENIFIIDESFNYNNNYFFLEKTNKLNLKNEIDFKHFYYFGNPVSMFPSDELLEFNIKFKLFKDLNTYLGSKKLDKISKNFIFNNFFNNIKIYGDEICELAIRQISSIDKNKKERFKLDIHDIKKKYYDKIDSYKMDILEIEVFKALIFNNEVKNEDDKSEKRVQIENKYFNRFNNLFKRLERPIVGIFDPDTKTVELLGVSFICKRSRDERFLDIKEISHNSPPYCHLFAGIAFAVPSIVILKNIVDSNNKKIIKSNNADKIVELEEKNRIFNDSIEELKTLIDEADIKVHKKIENEYTCKNIQEIYDDVLTKSTDNIKKYGFENSNIKSKVIEFDEYKK